MPRVRWSAQAERDAAEIVRHIGLRKARAADRFLLVIQDKVGRLDHHSGLGRPSGGQGRELVVRPNYIVHHREDPEEVLILRVLHAARRHP